MQEKSEPKKEIHWVFTQLRMGGLPRSLKLGVFLGTRSNRLRFLSIFKEILQGGPPKWAMLFEEEPAFIQFGWVLFSSACNSRCFLADSGETFQKFGRRNSQNAPPKGQVKSYWGVCCR